LKQLQDVRTRLVHEPSSDVNRIATDLVDILERRRATLVPTPWTSPSPPLESIGAIPATAQRVLDLSGSDETATLVHAIRPHATVDRQPRGTYDVVLLGYALARTADRDVLMRSLRTMLEPGGCAIVEFTNARNLRAAVEVLDDFLWTGRRVGRDPSVPPMTLSAVRGLLTAHDFAIDHTIVREDASLDAIDPSARGSLSAGRVSLTGFSVAELAELKVSGFTLVVKAKR
jgi:hypothetical protein